MEIVYEDNHIIIANKAPGEIVQGDKTGDTPLLEMVREYIREKYNKPGNVFCGLVHRIDRPVAGLVIFAKTSKALTRLNEMLRRGLIHKTYRAIVQGVPNPPEGRIESFLTSNQRTNKSYVSPKPSEGAKQAILDYKLLNAGERYSLLEVNLLTGRKHQIRAQLSSIGHPIVGDLKYGARRSNPDGSISLQAYRLHFTHPVSGKEIDITAPALKNHPLWNFENPSC